MSPLVEDIGRTWVRGKAVSRSYDIPLERLPIVSPDGETATARAAEAIPNLSSQMMSAAASTVTLENPLTSPGDHHPDEAVLLNAQSIQSLAETYVMDANDTLAASGVPPVVIYNSVEQMVLASTAEFRGGDSNAMETSNTCTLPHQSTMTSCPSPDETEALEIFEKEINDGDFKGEADSLSSDGVSYFYILLILCKITNSSPIISFKKE